MGLIIILPLTCLSVWATLSIHRWLAREKFGGVWLKRFWLSAAVGLVVGIAFAFVSHYQIGNVQMDGFPIPVAMNNREKPGEPWITANIPVLIRVAARITDLLSGIALCLIPVAIGGFVKELREEAEEKEKQKTLSQP